jgi:hypothetical protein
MPENQIPKLLYQYKSKLIDKMVVGKGLHILGIYYVIQQPEDAIAKVLLTSVTLSSFEQEFALPLDWIVWIKCLECKAIIIDPGFCTFFYSSSPHTKNILLS